MGSSRKTSGSRVKVTALWLEVKLLVSRRLGVKGIPWYLPGPLRSFKLWGYCGIMDEEYWWTIKWFSDVKGILILGGAFMLHWWGQYSLHAASYHHDHLQGFGLMVTWYTLTVSLITWNPRCSVFLNHLFHNGESRNFSGERPYVWNSSWTNATSGLDSMQHCWFEPLGFRQFERMLWKVPWNGLDGILDIEQPLTVSYM